MSGGIFCEMCLWWKSTKIKLNFLPLFASSSLLLSSALALVCSHAADRRLRCLRVPAARDGVFRGAHVCGLDLARWCACEERASCGDVLRGTFRGVGVCIGGRLLCGAAVEWPMDRCSVDGDVHAARRVS